MSVLNRAKQHFSDRMDETMECVEVPEWGDENGPAKIWYRPAINLREQNQIGTLASAGKNDEALAMSVILRARHAAGRLTGRTSARCADSGTRRPAGGHFVALPGHIPTVTGERAPWVSGPGCRTRRTGPLVMSVRTV